MSRMSRLYYRRRSAIRQVRSILLVLFVLGLTMPLVAAPGSAPVWYRLEGSKRAPRQIDTEVKRLMAKGQVPGLAHWPLSVLFCVSMTEKAAHPGRNLQRERKTNGDH